MVSTKHTHTKKLFLAFCMPHAFSPLFNMIIYILFLLNKLLILNYFVDFCILYLNRENLFNPGKIFYTIKIVSYDNAHHESSIHFKLPKIL